MAGSKMHSEVKKMHAFKATAHARQIHVEARLPAFSKDVKAAEKVMKKAIANMQVSLSLMENHHLQAIALASEIANLEAEISGLARKNLTKEEMKKKEKELKKRITRLEAACKQALSMAMAEVKSINSFAENAAKVTIAY